MFSNLRARGRTLSARLIAGQLALLALVCLVIGVATVFAVRALLIDQLDGQIIGASSRATNFDRNRPGGYGGLGGGPDQGPPSDAPGLPPGTITAVVHPDGNVQAKRLAPGTAAQQA